MVGMFRLVKDGKAIFYELMTILEENNSLVMKLKHFSPDLNGWEEKNASQNFPLVKVGSNEALFNTLSYRKLDNGSLQILVVLKQKSGEMAEEEFHLQPAAKWPATAKTLSRPTGDEATVEFKGKSLMATHGLKINVDDMKKALSFYVQKLGFEIEDRSDYPRRVGLRTDDRIKLILNRVERLRKTGPTDTQVGLTLQVNDLGQTIIRKELSKDGRPGRVVFSDPFGNISELVKASDDPH